MIPIWKNRIGKSITTKFMFISFFIFFGIALAATCGRVWIDYTETQKSVFESLIITHKAYERGLSRAIWFMDKGYLETEVNGIMQNPHMALIQIQGDRNQHYVFGKKTDNSNRSRIEVIKHNSNSRLVEQAHARWIKHEFSLTHTAEDGELYQVGKATFIADERVIFEKLRDEVLLAVIYFIVLVAALGIIVYFIGGRILTRPLIQLTTAIQRFNPERSDGSLDLSLFRGNDELETVARAFAAMQTRLTETVSSLRKRETELTELTQNLETIVENKTADLIRSNTRLKREILERNLAEKSKEKVIRELQATLEEVKLLSGLLPICSICKKIRDDKGYWNQIESYIDKHSEAEFSHSLCPQCAKDIYPDLEIYNS